MFSTVIRIRKLVLLCFRRRDLVLYCSQEKETGELLFSGEGNMFSIVFRRREHVHYCYQEKETGALMFQEKGSGALQTAVLKEKETGALLLMFSREGRWGCTYRFYRFLSI